MKRFEIWYANVKFEDSAEVKERPVLIWDDKVFVIAYKMTSTNRGDTQREFQVEYWKEAGLAKPTTIRIHKLLKLTQSDLTRKIGELDQRDRLRFLLRVSG